MTHPRLVVAAATKTFGHLARSTTITTAPRVGSRREVLRAFYHASCILHSKEQPEPKAASESAVTTTTTSKKVEELFQKIIYLDMIEMHLLTELINEKLGIKYSDAQRAQLFEHSTGGTTPKKDNAAAKEQEEEQTAFDLILTSFDAKAKLKVIKEVRTISGLGLKDAKDLVEGAPKVIKKGLKKDEAEEMKEKLEKVGATVEVS